MKIAFSRGKAGSKVQQLTPTPWHQHRRFPLSLAVRRMSRSIRNAPVHEAEYEHAHIPDKAREEIAAFIWRQESLELTTVGIDIGSSTSHLLFARVLMQRQSQGLSSRFAVTRREVVWRSPIMLTPFLPDGTIDASALGDFIHDCYGKAGFGRGDVDSGAVILTGEAIKRRNARAIDELFAEEAGKFVCATAGHKLEAMLAAHGSGAVAVSKRRGECLLHVDIGGGTTKMALIDDGRILDVSAFAVGGRVLAVDAKGAWTRIDETARLAAADLGLTPTAVSFADIEVRRQIARSMAGIIVDNILDAPRDTLGRTLQLTEPLTRAVAPVAVSISGGVAEYVFGREKAEYGDIAPLLADELIGQFSRRLAIPVIDAGQGIRATVIGASQFTVQVSGKTIYLPAGSPLPARNIPVLRVDLAGWDGLDSEALRNRISSAMKRTDIQPQSCLALTFAWEHSPEYGKLAALARAIAAVFAPQGHREELLLLMIDGDIGKSLGHLLHEELGLVGPLVSIDGVQLQELDFVDVGGLVEPPGVVPVVIKSLLFG
jgi:ethanolamine utilization protein EutA